VLTSPSAHAFLVSGRWLARSHFLKMVAWMIPLDATGTFFATLRHLTFA
jgi:hypothetical protein